MDTATLTGSDKQITWASSVIKKFQTLYPDTELPSVQDANFWIRHRNATIEELLSDSRNVTSVFTSVYPRYNLANAMQFLSNIPDNLVILDVETTGIGKSGEVCEVAIVRYEDRSILLNTLIRPLKSYSETSKAGKIHRISLEDIHDAPTLPDVWDDLVSILTYHHVASFNTDFDIRMIRNSAMVWALDVPPLTATCIMKLATAFIDADYYCSLEEVASYLGVSYTEGHRALHDTMVTCEVLAEMAKEVQ